MRSLHQCRLGKQYEVKTAIGIASLLLFVLLISFPPQTCLRLLLDPFNNSWRFQKPDKYRPEVDDYIVERCASVSDTFGDLIRDSSLGPWRNQTLTQQQLEAEWNTILYVHKDRIYISANARWERLTPVYHALLQRLRLHVQLPDLILPINPLDEPQSLVEQPRFVLGYCRRRGHSTDVLIPDLKNGDVFKPSLVRRSRGAYRAQRSRAGPNDKRKAMAVWRGSVGGRNGMLKGRTALMDLSLVRPDLVDAGMRDWDTKEWGPDNGRVKPYMSFRQQVDTYQMQIWVPGNCAAVRLGAQLASDAVVLKIDSPEFEWFEPLLRPWEHYIPVAFHNSSHVGIEEAILWARQHPEEVAAISARATAFAERFLSVDAVECYMLQLLQAIRRLQPDSFQLPPNATANNFR